MNIKFLNPFVESASEVLQAETGITTIRGKLGLDKNVYITDEVTVIISLVGQVEGNVFYSMSKQTAVNLVTKMLGENIPEFDAFAQSGIAELGNVITGQASIKLSESGFEATISPPALILGTGASISTLDYTRLVVPFESKIGTITIHLALRQNTTSYLLAAELSTPEQPKSGI